MVWQTEFKKALNNNHNLAYRVFKLKSNDFLFNIPVKSSIYY